MWLERGHRGGHCGLQDAHVVHLVVRAVVLAEEVARVGAARVVLVRALDAVRVARALGSDGLVVRYVSGEATEVGLDAQVLHERHERRVAVLPPEPATVGRVHIQRARGARGLQCLDGVRDAGLVGAGRVRAVRVGHVGGHVGERVRLDDEHDWDLALEVGENGGEWVDVVVVILFEAVVACPRVGIVVACPVIVIYAADFTVRRLGLAIAIGQVVHDESDERRGRLGGSVGEDTLHRRGAIAQDLALHVDPVRRRHVQHRRERRLHSAAGRIDGTLQLSLVRRVHVERIDVGVWVALRNHSRTAHLKCGLGSRTEQGHGNDDLGHHGRADRGSCRLGGAVRILG
mmetsp:Transcript_6801/g.16235  ORF Transcript_6801/g.16235 Transcript_6801/m.16235 type:complete len:345 (-) Transcript_6801:16-1050(-)